MSNRTYESKKISDLNWSKYEYVVLKKNGSPVWKENGYSILYKDSSSNKIDNISINYGDWSYSEISDRLDTGWAFELSKDDVKLFGKVVTLSNRNSILLLGNENFTKDNLKLVITKSNSDEFEVNLVGEGLAQSTLYSVELSDIGTELSSHGPVAISGVVYNRESNIDNLSSFGYCIKNDKLYINFSKNPTELLGTIQVAKDLTESGLSVSTPFTIVPRTYGDSLKVYSGDEIMSSVSGKYPNRYYVEGDIIKGIGIADIVSGGLSGESPQSDLGGMK